MCGGHSSAAPEGVSRTVRTIGELLQYITLYHHSQHLTLTLFSHFLLDCQGRSSHASWR